MSNHDSANAPGLPSRRRFLSLAGKAGAAAAATATALGGLGAAAAISQPAIAALPSAAISESPDPVIALAERFIAIEREHIAACDALTPCEAALVEWRKKNPRPVVRETKPRPNAAITLDRAQFLDKTTGEPLTSVEAWPGLREANAEHEKALRKWRRREQAAERRTGYREANQAINAILARWRIAQDELRDAMPIGWEGLAAKARAFRLTYGESEDDLMQALMRDIGVLSGEFLPAEADAMMGDPRPQSIEELRSAESEEREDG